MKGLARRSRHPRNEANQTRSVLRIAPIAAGWATVLATAVWAVQAARTHLALTEGERQLGKGFAALAIETLDPARHRLVSSDRGCNALVQAYLDAQRPERLEWASQACINAGFDTARNHVGLAASRELVGRDADAMTLLAQVAVRFPEAAEPHYRMAQIHRRANRNRDAADELLLAADLAPHNFQFSMEALEQSLTVERWDEARRMADRIKGIETSNPLIKSVIALALFKGGDKEGAKAVAKQARALTAHQEASRKVASSPKGSSGGEKAQETLRMQPPPLSPATPPRKF